MKEKNTELINFCKILNLYYKDPSQKTLIYLKKSFNKIKTKQLDNGNKFILIKKFGSSKNIIRKKLIILSKLRKFLEQNQKKQTIVEVRPNIRLINRYKKNIKKKIRYHQTNLGGSIHSDGPQLSTPPTYIGMACAEGASTGGYSIIVNMERIYQVIKKNNPRILNILKEKFFFERRGFGKKVLNKPIFSYKNNKLCFRYLRDYIESAFLIKKQKIIDNQKKALDYLDKLIQNKKYQMKFKLSQGDFVIINNCNMAHGRTNFKLSKNSNRNLLRVWLK
jgi:hypothetical protein